MLTAATSRCPGPSNPIPPVDWQGKVGESALVERSAALRDHPEFKLTNVLGQILRTSGATDSPAAREQLLQSLLDSFRRGSNVNPASGLAMRVDVRNADAGQSARALLDETTGMQAVGLFNRLDVAPVTFTDCGEYRIAYSTPDSNFLLIFEAKMPNMIDDRPRPESDCAQIARYWAELQDLQPGARLTKLADFYFRGAAGYPAVVNALNYGARLGQVRSNSFRNGPWQLREFLVDPKAGAPTFVPNPVAESALAEFYQDNNLGTQNPSLPLQEQERVAFQSAFHANFARHLVEPDSTLANLPSDQFASEITSRLGANLDLRFREFQSDAEQPKDNPEIRAGAVFRGRIPDQVFAENGITVSRDHLLARAHAITCGGCHQTAVDRPIATGPNGPVTWPRTLGFRHIAAFSEPDPALPGASRSQLSVALTDMFIPFRTRQLIAFLNKHQPGPNTARAAGVRTDDEIATTFRQIVASRTAIAGAEARYQELVRERRSRDEMTQGYFVRYRRSH